MLLLQRPDPGAGQNADMGVVFFVDPDMLKDPDTREVRTITLSYTMFRAAERAAAQRRSRTGPSPAAHSVN